MGLWSWIQGKGWNGTDQPPTPPDANPDKLKVVDRGPDINTVLKTEFGKGHRTPSSTRRRRVLSIEEKLLGKGQQPDTSNGLFDPTDDEDEEDEEDTSSYGGGDGNGAGSARPKPKEAADGNNYGGGRWPSPDPYGTPDSENEPEENPLLDLNSIPLRHKKRQKKSRQKTLKRVGKDSATPKKVQNRDEKKKQRGTSKIGRGNTQSQRRTLKRTHTEPETDEADGAAEEEGAGGDSSDDETPFFSAGEEANGDGASEEDGTSSSESDGDEDEEGAGGAGSDEDEEEYDSEEADNWSSDEAEYDEEEEDLNTILMRTPLIDKIMEADEAYRNKKEEDGSAVMQWNKDSEKHTRITHGHIYDAQDIYVFYSAEYYLLGMDPTNLSSPNLRAISEFLNSVKKLIYNETPGSTYNEVMVRFLDRARDQVPKITKQINRGIPDESTTLIISYFKQMRGYIAAVDTSATGVDITKTERLRLLRDITDFLQTKAHTGIFDYRDLFQSASDLLREIGRILHINAGDDQSGIAKFEEQFKRVFELFITHKENCVDMITFFSRAIDAIKDQGKELLGLKDKVFNTHTDYVKFNKTYTGEHKAQLETHIQTLKNTKDEFHDFSIRRTELVSSFFELRRAFNHVVSIVNRQTADYERSFEGYKTLFLSPDERYRQDAVEYFERLHTKMSDKVSDLKDWYEDEYAKVERLYHEFDDFNTNVKDFIDETAQKEDRARTFIASLGGGGGGGDGGGGDGGRGGGHLLEWYTKIEPADSPKVKTEKMLYMQMPLPHNHPTMVEMRRKIDAGTLQISVPSASLGHDGKNPSSKKTKRPKTNKKTRQLTLKDLPPRNPFESPRSAKMKKTTEKKPTLKESTKKKTTEKKSEKKTTEKKSEKKSEKKTTEKKFEKKSEKKAAPKEAVDKKETTAKKATATKVPSQKKPAKQKNTKGTKQDASKTQVTRPKKTRVAKKDPSPPTDSFVFI